MAVTRAPSTRHSYSSGSSDARMRRRQRFIRRHRLPKQLRQSRERPERPERPWLFQRLAAFILLLVRGASSREGKKPNRFRSRLEFRCYLREFTCDEFRRTYRMPLSCFMRLLETIRDKITCRKPSQARGGGVIHPELKLSMTLRHLAGGSYLDVIRIHGVSQVSCATSQAALLITQSSLALVFCFFLCFFASVCLPSVLFFFAFPLVC